MTGDGVRAGATFYLRRRLLLMFSLLGAVVAVLVVGVVVSTVGFVSAGDDVIYRWQPLLVHSAQLTTDLVDEETGVRGYVISGNRTFLAPYRAALASEKQHIARIRDLAGGDRVLRDDLARVVSAADAWRAAVATPVIAAGPSGMLAARAVVENPSSKTAFDLIRTRAQTLNNAALQRAGDARDERTRWGVVFLVTLSLGGVAVLGGAWLLWWGQRRWVLRPIEVLGRQTRQVASGDLYREITASGPAELTDLGVDVESMRRRIAEELTRAELISDELRRKGQELERSNQDLQQFAYVASHDLSEPLRKVANFCQLLERQYADQLDDRARQYIHFAVDGAKRMQALITDLLALSRVGRNTDGFVDLDLDAKLDQALATLADRIAASGATVVRETPLPSLHGDRALMVSLFENLVGNAIKYRREDVAPVVRIAARHEPGRTVITVADNGIGIEPQYAERIFAVFQRLHVREKYEGTGIGLAMCRRIVEYHGGQIRLAPVESGQTYDHGATFEIALPDNTLREGKSGA